MSEIGPCQYPRCRDADGNPRLTQATFCDSCQRRYRKLLDWIVLDYTLLRHDLPAPVRLEADGSDHAAPKSKSFGHPAEWASIKAAEIADSLNWAEDGLRDLLGHEPPPHPGSREVGRVAHAYRYLTDQFAALCNYDAAADTAIELAELHHKVRRMLGYTRIVQLLPTPCPWCDTAALVRDVGSIECRECGKTVTETHYDWLANYLIDAIIDAYDTPIGA